jgi:predicted RNA-binding Zn-ribbon protein involved in translation (DUF1610 family)
VVTVSGETRICPVCDAKIDSHARRCPECSTDLSLFDVDKDGIPDLDGAPAPAGKTIDDILASIIQDKEVRPDIFEDIKTMATTGESAKGETGAEFLCPSCGERVAPNARKCPTCGTAFAEEAVEQFECPLCNAVVDVDATSCPSCGVQFAQDVAVPAVPGPMDSTLGKGLTSVVVVDELELEEKPALVATGKPVGASHMERLWRISESRRIAPVEAPADRGSLYKELPRLVGEVKPLLLIAKKVGVEIGEEKELIGEAIAFGKKRDVERAVELIRQARFRLDRTFTGGLAKRIESVLVEAERSKQAGTDVGEIVALCISAIDALEVRDFSASADRIKAAKQELDARSGGYGKARQEYAASKSLLADARKLGLELRETNTALKRAESALQARNWDEAAGLAVQARQSLVTALPDLLNREMKKARNALLEMKVKGGDLAKPVGILKQASIHIKREDYAEATKFVSMFWDHVGRP